MLILEAVTLEKVRMIVEEPLDYCNCKRKHMALAYPGPMR